MKDFTLSMYEKLCTRLISSEYLPITLKSFFTNSQDKKIIIIRHDVDYNIDDALSIAEIENRLGIYSTFYIRLKKKNHNLKKIEKIKKFGHEIGYHYDVIDKAYGDIKKAESIFKNELKILREICSIETISPHGSGLTKWINDYVLRYIKLERLGIIGDAMNSINFNNILYISDTGMSWDISKQHNMKDHPPNYQIPNNRLMIKCTNDIIKLINNDKIENKIYLSIHPENWARNNMVLWRKYVNRRIKNFGKIILNR